MRTRFYFVPNQSVTSFRKRIGKKATLLVHMPPESEFMNRFLEYLDELPEEDREWIIKGTDEKQPARQAVQEVFKRWGFNLRFLDCCQYQEGTTLTTELFVHY